MKLFNDDDETDAVIMVGEIGGDAEETCARWMKDNFDAIGVHSTVNLRNYFDLAAEDGLERGAATSPAG